MAGSVNMPGVLSFGDLSSTTSVSFGRGGALAVDNSGTGTAGSVSIAGAYSLGSFNFGSAQMTCGSLSTSSITSSFSMRCDFGSASAPAFCFGTGTDSTTGFYVVGTSSTVVVSAGVELLRTGPGVIVSAPLDATGNTMSCGAMTCGALGCASVASTGDVTQPRYALRVTKTSNQSVASSATTAVVWDAEDSSGGGATNWPFTPGSTLLTCPQAGKYCFALSVAVLSGSNTCLAWVEINPPGGVPGSSRRYGEAALVASGGGTNWVSGGGFTYQLSAGDTIVAAVFHTTGIACNVGVSGNTQSEFSITRLSE
jgi:hypothetical protein